MDGGGVVTDDNRIPEIRAYHHRVSGLQGEGEGIGSWCSCSDLDCKVLYLLDCLDALEQPAPRVFFPGDTVPGGVVVAGVDGAVWGHNVERNIQGGYAVEIQVPDAVSLQAAVDRARAAREENPDGTYTPCRFEVIPGVGEDGRCIANATVDGYCKPHADAVRAALQGDQ